MRRTIIHIKKQLYISDIKSLLRKKSSLPLLFIVPLTGVAGWTHAADDPPVQETPDAVEMDTMEVVGTTPLHGIDLPRDKLPANVQTATGDDIDRSLSVDLTEFMRRRLTSISINDAQNNPLQPDIQFRGFTASPLLGLPQGMAVYQNGARINEPFGDTVNWDLIPPSAIESINLIPGSNPLFGLNTLGGALSVRMKNGFSAPGHRARLSGGSFGRVNVRADSGMNNGTFGYFVTGRHFEEDGWRDFSDSRANNAYASVGWQGGDSTLDLGLTLGDTELKGNGAAPVQLLAQRRQAVFTHPDVTENKLEMATLEGSHWMSDSAQLSGMVYLRGLDTDSFNGDGSAFEECEGTGPETGTLADPDDFRCENAGEPDEELVRDQNGNPVLESDDAINNLSRREQESWGGSIQTTLLQDLFGHENLFIVGGSYDRGEADFASDVEVAQLTETRGTTRTGRLVTENAVRLRSETDSWSVYATDTITPTDKLALTFSGRYNNTNIKIRDRSGVNPALNGDHTFDRFNPALGATYWLQPELQAYGGYNESNRAPTPVELTCADPDAPCILPNAFLADPPLEQVVAKTWEAGLRGRFGPWAQWSAGLFSTRNKDDIYFISTGGTTSNQGFFDNIGDTRRRGVELMFNGAWKRLGWYLGYTYLDATFESAFTVSSPNHPLADANGDIQVGKGNRIPGIPEHNFKIGGEVDVTQGLSIGADLVHNSDQVFRGDEANLLDTVDGYTVVDLNAAYRFNRNVSVFAKVKNLFDTEYETFGLLGEPDEVLGPAFDDPRFVGPGAERGIWIGLELAL